MEKQAAARDAETETWMQKYDMSHTGTLSRAEVRAMLNDVKREVTSDPAAEVRDQLLDKVMTTFATDSDHMPPNAVLNAIRKYKLLLKKEAELDPIFEKYASCGLVDPAQLQSLLAEAAPRRRVVEPSDVGFILARTDADKNGKLDREELGAAVALWREVAPVEQKSSSSACILL